MEMDLDRPTSLILRACDRDGKSNGGAFQWPRSGYVEPDGYDKWDPHNPPWYVPEDNGYFSRGLYGFLNGEGDRTYLPYAARGNNCAWLVVETYADEVLKCVGKVKFPYAWVVGWYGSESEAMRVIRSGEGLQYQLREQKAAKERAIADEKRRQEEEEEHQAWLDEQQRREEKRQHQIWLARQEEERRQEAVAEKPVEAPREAQKPLYVAESMPLPSTRSAPVYEAPAQPKRQQPTYQGMTEGDKIFLAVCSVVLGWTLKLLWATIKVTMRAAGKVLLVALRKFVALAKPPAPRVVIIKQQDEAFLQLLGAVRELGVTSVKQIAVGNEQPAFWVFEKQEVV
jgi:hypothetical protein